jgi:uncharacterized hydrophobic protein (TIGR00271 family)
VLSAYLKRLSHNLAATVETAVSRVDNNGVIKDLTGRANLSGSYLLMIASSCLVALLGLLTNSVAVVIGAMLISPLMGPIFTAGLSFSMGDLRLARKVLKIILVSILLSVAVSAFFTVISPLKDPTQEIISRTRPNIYDLLIAACAGAAGAYALCTRVSYLFVTTGVAVATAVIPPLSVVGYGLGTGQTAIALGGFFLFFTNLVAIIISSFIVFHIFRFRPSMVEEARYPVRRRVQILAAVLVLISIPLVYTLVTEIRKVNLQNRIGQALKSHLNKKDYSRMTGFSFQKGSGGFTVAASVNTVSYYNVSTAKRIENDLETAMKGPVQLELEQVKVRTGGVEPQFPVAGPPLAGVPVPVPRPETLADLREKAIDRIKEGCQEVRPVLLPYPITQCGLRFSDQEARATVMMTVARDFPFSEAEQSWMKVVLEKKLGGPLELELKTVPFLPPMDFGKDGKLEEGSRKALEALKPLVENGHAPPVVITAPHRTRRYDTRSNRDVASLKKYLAKELGYPASLITRGPDRGSDLRLKIEASP